MKTTEIFVEQVLVGFLVLLVPAIVFSPEIARFGSNIEAISGLVAGVGVVGIAYVVGIVFDRIADTLLRDYDRYNRFLFLDRETLKTLKSLPELEGDEKNEAETPEPNRSREAAMSLWPATATPPGQRLVDYDETKIRNAITKESASDYHDYLRSRIRITRSLCPMIPALAVAVMTRNVFCDDAIDQKLVVTFALFAVYSIVLVAKIVYDRVPRTDAHRDRVEAFQEVLSSRLLRLRFWIAEPASLALLGGLIYVLWLWSEGTLDLVLVLACVVAFVATLIVGWAWWRIQRTYFAFLFSHRNVEQLVEE